MDLEQRLAAAEGPLRGEPAAPEAAVAFSSSPADSFTVHVPPALAAAAGLLASAAVPAAPAAVPLSSSSSSEVHLLESSLASRKLE